jgi:predicted transcriptional regulator
MITKDELVELIKEGYTLSKIAEMKGVSVSHISQLCKEYEIERPKPGRAPGYQHSVETRQKISETIRKKREEG